MAGGGADLKGEVAGLKLDFANHRNDAVRLTISIEIKIDGGLNRPLKDLRSYFSRRMREICAPDNVKVSIAIPGPVPSSSPKYEIAGWRRLTTGTGNILGTDWQQQRVMVS